MNIQCSLKSIGYFVAFGYLQKSAKAVVYKFEIDKYLVTSERTPPPDKSAPVFAKYDIDQGKCENGHYAYQTWLHARSIEEIPPMALSEFINLNNNRPILSFRGQAHYYIGLPGNSFAEKNGENWTEEELRAAVEAYIEMRSKELRGISFAKNHYYKKLAEQFGRTEKSYEYRMQNISYVYSLLGRPWLSGLKPAKNVGSRNVGVIERLIAEIEGNENRGSAFFEAKVKEARQKNFSVPPQGNRQPSKNPTTAQQFVRDPEVKAWVLQQAAGRCESCGANAPFVSLDNQPFLEVHHVKGLADGGSDTVYNAVALCPNCHREMHHGIEREMKIESLILKVERLTLKQSSH